MFPSIYEIGNMRNIKGYEDYLIKFMLFMMIEF
jgi:hypothetical protein